MRPVWFSSLFQYLVGALCWRAQKGSRECPSTQIEPRSFKGSVRAVCPTPPLQLVSQYTKQFWERKWSKIMQSNSEEERKKRNWHLHECFTGADAACRWFIKKKKKKRLAAGPVIETPWYVHVPCTCNYNLSTDSKGVQKAERLWQ